jgi:hypothetical protein
LSHYELESRWVTEAGIPGVDFGFSDLVRIKSGQYAGQAAEVISLLSIEAEPLYMVEIASNGKSVALSQSDLDPTGRSAGRTLELIIRNPPS